MITANADDLAALRAYLLDHTEITDLVGQRVFDFELPEKEAIEMPRPVILIEDAGFGSVGQMSRSYLPFGASTKTIRCYAETRTAARDLWLTCAAVLEAMRRHLRGDVLLYSVTMGGAVSLVEPEVNWPVTYSNLNLTAAKVV